MKPTVAIVVSLAAVAASAGRARAEDVATYEVEGEADAGAPDPRVAALDDAFARAARRALEDVVAGAVRTQKKQELDREILGHARLWIARFAVTRDLTDDDRRQLTVTVRVDRDKVRARLAELNIPTVAGDATPAESPGDDPTSHARGVAILLRVADGDAIRATYGAKPDKDTPGAAALAGALKTAGYAIRRASTAASATVATTAELGDADARALAAAAKAELALVAGVTVDAPAPVRGLAGPQALVTARARLVDAASGRALGQGETSVAVDADARTTAVERGLRAALVDIVPPPAHALAPATAPTLRDDGPPLASPGVVLVRLPAKTPWALVLAEARFLAHARGVTSATVRRLSPAGYVLGVATASSVDQIAATARRAPAADVTASVRVVGEVVEVALAGAAGTPPP